MYNRMKKHALPVMANSSGSKGDFIAGFVDNRKKFVRDIIFHQVIKVRNYDNTRTLPPTPFLASQGRGLNN